MNSEEQRRPPLSLLEWDEDRLLPEAAQSALTGSGAPFEMAGEDVLGVGMRVFARRPLHMRQVLEGAPDRFGEQPFLVFPERTFTHTSLVPAVAAVAASLRRRYGIRMGDRVAVVAANVPGQALTVWAAICLGAVVVELNGWWTGAEMLHGLELTQPKVLLGDRRRLDRLSDQRVGCPVVCFEEQLAALEEEGRGESLPPVAIGENDPFCILFTSGTTGRPKGAVLPHRAPIHMMMQAALQAQVTALLEPASTSSGAPAAGAGCSIGVSPMFHISGFLALVGGPLIGSTIVYPSPGRWDPEQQLEMTQRHRATQWSVVPTQLWRLIDHPRFEEYDLSSLRRVGGGGSTYQPELWKRVRERLPHLERMSTGYGMTETFGAGTHQDGRAASQHPEAVGAPVPGYSISVRGTDGEILPEGETGEIWLRGACNFLGYWADPDATALVLDEDRWYHTGELGHISDGLLYLDGRGSDLIIRGGENIYPIEIENRLIEHPGVSEVAVIGVPDRVLGEMVKAVIVPAAGAAIDESSVREWVGASLARFKVPEIVEFVRELPHNAAGKVLKTQLRGSGRPIFVEEG